MTPPADLNGHVRSAEIRNLVSARMPSHSKRSLLQNVSCQGTASSRLKAVDAYPKFLRPRMRNRFRDHQCLNLLTNWALVYRRIKLFPFRNPQYRGSPSHVISVRFPCKLWNSRHAITILAVHGCCSRLCVNSCIYLPLCLVLRRACSSRFCFQLAAGNRAAEQS
jgi:hypothetical protein